MKISFAWLMLFVSGHVCAQSLQIGDTVPDVFLKSVINDSRSSGPLSTFRKKLTILDFWGTGCSVCIEAFPHLSELQKQFPDELQILAVNSEPTDSLKRFLRRYKKVRLPEVPCITGDTVLRMLFPHVYMPHHVWIDSAGVVRYITGGHNATREHVDAYLSGKSLDLAEQKYAPDYAYHRLWDVVHAKPTEVPVLGYSLLTGMLPGTRISRNLQASRPGGANNIISAGPNPITELYRQAFEAAGQHRFAHDKTIELRTKDSAKLVRPSDGNLVDEWEKKNIYTYELMVPEDQADHLFPIMQNDLARYFGIHGRIELQPRPFLVLEILDEKKFPATRHKVLRTNLWLPPLDTVKYAEAYPFDAFAAYLRGNVQNHTKYLFHNATGYKEKLIDINFPGSVIEDWDLKKVNRMLFKFGLILTEKDLPIEVLVLE